MSEVIIKLENVSKQYRLGTIGTNTLRGDLQRFWYNIRGKQDPTLKIGQENKLDTKDGEYVWALKDINLEVKQGDVLGIIGKNGAGKSTLLKILSRVTGPTTGNIKLKGRIASLLEVGTGFHPELTGKENIFLNGAILGMTKSEIKSKLDEIVDFAGISKYIDTPVKRYSSGMYVRLAFAVAAHLDPEILIVDEVLAVGDAEFQKKAIGKMKDISKEQGRTVMFVSHNMSAVSALCSSCIIVQEGKISHAGNTDNMINTYINNNLINSGFIDFTKKNQKIQRIGNRFFCEILNLTTLNENDEISDTFFFGKGFKASANILIKKNVKNPEFGFCISTTKEHRLHHFISKWENPIQEITDGIYKIDLSVPQILLYPGEYTLTVWYRYFANEGSDDFIESPLTFKVLISDFFNKFIDFSAVESSGGVYNKSSWKINKIQNA